MDYGGYSEDRIRAHQASLSPSDIHLFSQRSLNFQRTETNENFGKKKIGPGINANGKMKVKNFKFINCYKPC